MMFKADTNLIRCFSFSLNVKKINIFCSIVGLLSMFPSLCRWFRSHNVPFNLSSVVIGCYHFRVTQINKEDLARFVWIVVPLRIQNTICCTTCTNWIKVLDFTCLLFIQFYSSRWLTKEYIYLFIFFLPKMKVLRVREGDILLKYFIYLKVLSTYTLFCA